MALSAEILPPKLNTCRLIPYQKYYGPMNMAIDLFLSKLSYLEDITIIRFYGWSPYCLSIGYHQKYELINHKKLEQDGFGFVRRPTGGRAIFHAEELTYSIHAPKKLIKQQQLYLFVHTLFTNALRELGLNVRMMQSEQNHTRITNQADDLPCFTKSAWSEVQYNGLKLIGSAQKIYQKSVLQHGSLMIGALHKSLPVYLNASEHHRRILEEEMIQKSTCLNEISESSVSCQQLIEAFLNQLELNANISVNCRNLSKYELQEAEKYVSLFCR